MIKRSFFAGFVFAFLIPAVLSAEMLDSQAETTIRNKLDSLSISDVAIDLNVRITIPDNTAAGIDGVDLFATVIRPKSACQPLYCEGRPYGRPTIVIATPYRREIMAMLYVALLNYDYNILALDIRGSGSSDGNWVSFAPPEHYDLGYVIDHFIPEQSWSDKRMGMIGPSYMAIGQLLAAGQIQSDNGVPRHLEALFPILPMSDVYRDIVMHGGNLDLEFIPLWLGMVDILGALPPLLYLGESDIFSPSLEDVQQATDMWEDHINNIPVTINWILDKDNVDKNDFYDSKSTMLYWPEKPAGGWQLGPEYPENLGETVIPENLPVFMIGGWFDIFTRGTINTWEYGLKNHSNSNKSMIVGPWYHLDGSMGMGMKGLLNCDIAARWFDWKIKEISDPFMVEYPVLLYILGEEKWRAEKSWPLPAARTETKNLYLSKKKAPYSLLDWFSTRNYSNNYAMVDAPQKEDYYNSYWFFKTFYTSKTDPVLEHDPQELHGLTSRSSTRWLMGLPALVSQLSKFAFNVDMDALMPWEDERSDEVGVLTFTTDELKADLEVLGPLKLTFWARTEFDDPLAQSKVDELLETLGKLNMNDTSIPHFVNKRDVQWVVEVNDVFPGGRARNISSGWLSAENRPFNPLNPREFDEKGYVAFNPFYDHAYKNPSPIEENQVYKYVVEVWPTANVFKKGHKIRVSLSASDFPHLFPVFRPSENTIVIDENHKAGLTFTRVTSNTDAIWVDDPTEYVLSSLH